MIYKGIIFDEEKIGRAIYDSGKIDDLNRFNLLSLSKYVRHSKGYGDAKLKTFLKEFLSKTSGFNYNRSRGYIGRIINSSKRDYTKVDPLVITDNELSMIRTIKNFKWQKIMLSVLMLSKRNINKGYLKIKDWIDVKSISALSHLTNSQIREVFHHMYIKGGILRPVENQNYDPAHEILFIDKESSGEVVFSIRTEQDARNLKKKYIDWCGGELYWCKECGVEFVKNGKTHYYCETCSKEKDLEKYRKYNKKRNIV